MSEDASPTPKKKSLIERMTGTAAQIAAFIVALSALITQLPGFTKTVSDTYCSIFSCSEPQPQPQAETSSATVVPGQPSDPEDTLDALEAAGISPGAAEPEWFKNEYTAYPFIADALLTLVRGKRLSQPLDIDMIVWSYEQGGDSPRRTADVDLARLKAAALTAHKESYGRSVAAFEDLIQ